MWQGLQQNSYTHKIPSWKLGRMLTTPLPFLIRSSMTKIWTPDSEMKSQMLCWWSQPRTYYNYGAQRCQNRSIHSSSLTQSFFGRLFLEIPLDTDFWIWHQKQRLQWKINNRDCIKLKAFCAAKEISSHQHVEKTTYWRGENICKLPNW